MQRNNLLILFLLGILVTLAIAQLDSVGDAEGDSDTIANARSCISDFESKCTSLNQCCSFNCENGECKPGIIYNSIIHKLNIDFNYFFKVQNEVGEPEKNGRIEDLEYKMV